MYPFEEHSAIVNAIKFVDDVIPEESWEQKQLDIVRHNIDILTMGSDRKGKFDFLSEGDCQIVYFPRTEGISSTEIKADIRTGPS